LGIFKDSLRFDTNSQTSVLLDVAFKGLAKGPYGQYVNPLHVKYC
jgi:hypothetical protein